MASPKNKNEYALTLVEVVVAMAAALLLMTTFAKLITSKMNAIHSAKETGELRDIRALLKRQLNCPATIAAGNCNSVANAEVRGLGCGGSPGTDLINLSPTGTNNYTRIGLTELKLRCGTDIGANRLFVEYRNSSSRNEWRDLNRGIPWTCEPAAAPSGITLTSTEFGAVHACSIGDDGEVYCWGMNLLGNLGDPSVAVALPHLPTSPNMFSSCPVKVQGLVAPVSDIKLGTGHSCARDATGWKCWGAVDGDVPYMRYRPANGFMSNLSDYLNEIQRSAVPVFTSFALPPSQFSISEPHSSCAVRAGGVVCWGNHASGAGLHGTIPIEVGGINGAATFVEGSAAKGCAIVSGGVMCWEQTWSSTSPATATFISGLEANSGVTQLSGTCAIANGIVRCWGFDYYGGQPTGLFSISNLAGQVSKIQGAYGEIISCALQAGAVKCYDGKIGIAQPGFGGMNVVAGLETGVTDLNCNHTRNTFAARCCAELGSHGQKCFGAGGGDVLSGSVGFVPPAPPVASCPGFSSGGSSPTTPPPAAACGN